MRVRFKRSLIIKLGIITLVLIFTIPYFVSRLDNTNRQDSLKFRSWNKLVNEVKQNLPFKDDSNNKENVGANPMDVVKMEESLDQQMEKTKFGPKAVMKKGVIGNFEPEYHIKAGPGEGGTAVYTSMEEKDKSDKTVREYGFNMVNSDKISLDRTIQDTRLADMLGGIKCRYWNYPDAKQLPTASVILVFHNEGWSTLLRTVHSVYNMSPPELLKEIVMVDDYSDKAHLKEPLADYIKEFNKKHNRDVVKLYRNSERLGLIRTRTRGAELSTADVIVFLDAHCECNRNWLVPLLERIAYDRKTMAVPIVDGIDWDNFKYHPVYGAAHHRGIFEWGFLYKESQVPMKELKRRQYNSEPYRSPTHAGGLFAMDRKYFFEMGAYDEGMQIWGGENFELSFKIIFYLMGKVKTGNPDSDKVQLWQCGGSIVWVPCSRVGHVYRNHMPYGFGKIDVKIPVILLNYMRVVEVWLDDEFKEYFYTREPSVRGYPLGNLTKQLKFKKDHNCKSFKWFMENVAYEVYDRFPVLPPNKAWGEVKQKQGMLCWDTLGQPVGGGPIGVSHCHHFGGNQDILNGINDKSFLVRIFGFSGRSVNFGSRHGCLIQMYRLNTKGQIGVGERCIEAPSGDTLHMSFCDTQPVGPWQWDENTGLIQHRNHEKCVEAGNDNRLHLQPCDTDKESQRWEINEIRSWDR